MILLFVRINLVYESTFDSRISSRNKYDYYYLYYKHHTFILDKVYNLRFHIEFCDAIFAMVIKKLSSDQRANTQREICASSKLRAGFSCIEKNFILLHYSDYFTLL